MQKNPTKNQENRTDKLVNRINFSKKIDWLTEPKKFRGSVTVEQFENST